MICLISPFKLLFLHKTSKTMNKKITLLVALLIGAFSGIQAQTSDAEADAIINLLGVQKKEAISKLVNVSGKDSAAFWKIYDEFQVSNKANAKARIGLYESTAQAYSNMTAGIADSLAVKYFANRMDQ